MTKAIFIFIASLLLLLPFVLNTQQIALSTQLIICIPFILLLGIPHGAIDNILYLREKKLSNSLFIALYVAIIGLNVLLWISLPSLAYVIFLFLSAYHFGQSQFTHYFKKQFKFFHLLYFSWGISILSSLVYFNIEELQELMSTDSVFAVFNPLHQKLHMFYLMIGSTGLTLALMIWLSVKKIISKELLLMELIVLSLILISFYLMPFLIGFTLYFIILHAIKVLREEYSFLLAKKEIVSVFSFVKLISPFTVLSIIGIAFLFGLIYIDLLQLSYGYCLLVIISSITLPHVFVMNRFYSLVADIK